jgi:hypothetical protein
MKLLIMHFSQSSCHFTHLGSNSVSRERRYVSYIIDEGFRMDTVTSTVNFNLKYPLGHHICYVATSGLEAVTIMYKL